MVKGGGIGRFFDWQVFSSAIYESYLVPLNTPNTIFFEESEMEDPSFTLLQTVHQIPPRSEYNKVNIKFYNFSKKVCTLN